MQRKILKVIWANRYNGDYWAMLWRHNYSPLWWKYKNDPNRVNIIRYIHDLGRFYRNLLIEGYFIEPTKMCIIVAFHFIGYTLVF